MVGKLEKYTKINNISYWVVVLEVTSIFFILFWKVSWKEQISFSTGGMDLPRAEPYPLLDLSWVVQLSDNHEWECVNLEYSSPL